MKNAATKKIMNPICDRRLEFFRPESRADECGVTFFPVESSRALGSEWLRCARGGAPTPGAVQRGPTKGLQPIVVAEENPDDLYLLTRRIKATGARNPIVDFFDTDDAIAYLTQALISRDDQALPCVLFTDTRLRDADGFRIVAWVRDQPEFSGIKVCVLTDSEKPIHRARATELKVDGYFRKFPEVETFRQVLAGEYT